MKLKLKETEIVKQILEWLWLKGVFAFRANTMGVPLKGGGFRPAPVTGVSDIIGVIPSSICGIAIPFFCEVKSAKGRVSEAQERFLGNADRAGAIVIITRSLEYVQKQLAPYLKQ